MKKIILCIAAASLSLGGCLGTTAAPPQAPVQVVNISRTAIDFALNSFDAALYGLDFAMAAGKLTPGSDKAKRIAAVGRKVQSFLRAAEAARAAGNAPSYEAAFASANTALSEFRSLLAGTPTAQIGDVGLSPDERAEILNRLAA